MGDKYQEEKKTIEEDHRVVAIYARESSIGDSISDQIEYCEAYARKHLNLSDNYHFVIFKDKDIGENRLYSERPGFQKMIRAVEKNEIRAMVCHKMDRLSRKISDFAQTVDILMNHDTQLLVAANNICTDDANSKYFIELLNVFSDFESELNRERIMDNLIEIEKEDYWIEDECSSGLKVKNTTADQNGKNRYPIFVPELEEKEMVQAVFKAFLSEQNYIKTAKIISEKGYKTREGLKIDFDDIYHILRNPVYAAADQDLYDYFLEHNGTIYGERFDYDATHGILVYKKSMLLRKYNDHSTILKPDNFNPILDKDIEEWAIVIGLHDSFVTGKEWIEAQKIAYEIFTRKQPQQIWEKDILTVEEAAALFNIGRNKIRELSNQKNCNFVLWVGNKRLIKKNLFEKFLEKSFSI